MIKKIICGLLIMSILGCMSHPETSVIALGSDIKIDSDQKISEKTDKSIVVKGNSSRPIIINITHPDYKPYNYIIEKSIKNDRYGLGLIGKISSIVFLSSVSYGLINNDFAQQDFFVGLTVGSMLIPLFDIFIPKKSYPKKISVKLKDIPNEYYLYDTEGYHKESGFNKYSHNRDGLYVNGSSFDGQINYGKKNGFGNFKDIDGLIYSGNYKNDKLEGIVFISSYEKLKSISTFRNGKLDGFSITLDENKRPIELHKYQRGSLIKTYDYSEHILKTNDNLYYLGDLKNGLASGVGQAISLINNEKIEGEFLDGYLVEGTKVRADGSIQKGVFKGTKLINGYYLSSDGSGGEGIWIDGKLQTPGKIIYPTGKVFLGDFDDNMIPTNGRLTFSNNDIYIGNFINGIPHGKGTYIFKNGTSYVGYFENGSFNGKGKLEKVNGEIYNGDFVDGLPHGFGIYKYKNLVEKSEYYEGKRIDQVYLLREEIKKAEIDKARKAELAEQERLKKEQEERERAIAKARAEEEQRRKAQKDKSVASGLFGVGSALLGMGMGLDVDDSLMLGASIGLDVYNDSLGAKGSYSEQTTEVLIETKRKQSKLKNNNATSDFTVKPQEIEKSEPVNYSQSKNEYMNNKSWSNFTTLYGGMQTWKYRRKQVGEDKFIVEVKLLSIPDAKRDDDGRLLGNSIIEYEVEFGNSKVYKKFTLEMGEPKTISFEIDEDLISSILRANIINQKVVGYSTVENKANNTDEPNVAGN